MKPTIRSAVVAAFFALGLVGGVAATPSRASAQYYGYSTFNNAYYGNNYAGYNPYLGYQNFNSGVNFQYQYQYNYNYRFNNYVSPYYNPYRAYPWGGYGY